VIRTLSRNDTDQRSAWAVTRSPRAHTVIGEAKVKVKQQLKVKAHTSTTTLRRFALRRT